MAVSHIKSKLHQFCIPESSSLIFIYSSYIPKGYTVYYRTVFKVVKLNSTKANKVLYRPPLCAMATSGPYHGCDDPHHTSGRAGSWPWPRRWRPGWPPASREPRCSADDRGNGYLQEKKSWAVNLDPALNTMSAKCRYLCYTKNIIRLFSPIRLLTHFRVA